MEDRLQRIEDLLSRHVEASAKRAADLERQVQDNTAITEQIRDAARAVSWIKRAVIWVGGLAAGLVGIWQLVAAIKAPGIGPTP